MSRRTKKIQPDISGFFIEPTAVEVGAPTTERVYRGEEAVKISAYIKAAFHVRVLSSYIPDPLLDTALEMGGRPLDENPHIFEFSSVKAQKKIDELARAEFKRKWQANFEAAVPEWAKAKDFDDLRSLMVRFIDGEIPATPWHGGPLEDESGELVEQLRETNNLGFLTVSSQPGSLTKVAGQRWAGWDGWAQRAYVEGLTDETGFQRLLTMANLLGYSILVRRPIELPLESDMPALSAQHYPSGDIMIILPICHDIRESFTDQYPDKPEVVNDLISVMLIDNLWNSNQMFGDIIDALSGKYDDRLEGLGIFK